MRNNTNKNLQTTKKNMVLFKQAILQKGYKNTSQREKIVEYIFQKSEHFTVDDIVNGFYQKGKKVSTATVYRAINLLISLNLLKKNNLKQGNSFYENIHNNPKHYHLICEECNNIVEFQEEKIEKIHIEICKKYQFHLSKEEIILYGKCLQENCKNKLQKNL